MDETKYWNSFYDSTIEEIQQKSTFALFIKDYLTSEDKVLELGCGNGRDTLYLSQYCDHVVAIDSSEKVIEKLKTITQENEKITFKCMDATNIVSLQYKPTFIYSRFFFHSIEERTEDTIFDYISNLPSKTLFCLECRSEQDIRLPK